MKRWILVLGATALLGLGMVLGSVLTRGAYADDTTTQGAKYLVVPLQRVDKNDPVAIWYSTQSGWAKLVYPGGSTSMLPY